jgi:hypothetical protein
VRHLGILPVVLCLEALAGFARILKSNGPYAPELSAARENSLNYFTVDGGIDRHLRDPLGCARRCAAVIGPPTHNSLPVVVHTSWPCLTPRAAISWSAIFLTADASPLSTTVSRQLCSSR